MGVSFYKILERHVKVKTVFDITLHQSKKFYTRKKIFLFTASIFYKHTSTF